MSVDLDWPWLIDILSKIREREKEFGTGREIEVSMMQSFAKGMPSQKSYSKMQCDKKGYIQDIFRHAAATCYQL